tara:strand:+ start:19 stop:969 length:951 start_codon:yes stop_codon:yes gene_type:complete
MYKQPINHKEIIIHIGYQKTASTYLQNEFFPRFTDKILRFGWPILRLLQQPTDQFDSYSFRNIIEPSLKNVRSIIISQEELSGAPLGTRGESYGNNIAFRFARNLSIVFPDAKIIIIIRKQCDYLISLYNYRVTVKAIEYRSFNEFIADTFKEDLKKKLSYDLLVREYIKLFSINNVLVLPFEMLNDFPNRFHEILGDFVGRKHDGKIISRKNRVNKSYGNPNIVNSCRKLNRIALIIINFVRKKIGFEFIGIRIRKYWGRVVKTIVSPLLSRVYRNKKNSKVYKHFEKRIMILYERSNRNLSQLTKIDLSDYNYY